MANLKSSKKDVRRTAKRTVARKPFQRNAEMFSKKLLKLVTAGKTKEAKEMLPQVFKAVDKAAKMNIFNKKRAARIKSRLSLRVGKMEAK